MLGSIGTTVVPPELEDFDEHAAASRIQAIAVAHAWLRTDIEHLPTTLVCVEVARNRPVRSRSGARREPFRRECALRAGRPSAALRHDPGPLDGSYEVK
jgi:hypothetical protein